MRRFVLASLCAQLSACSFGDTRVSAGGQPAPRVDGVRSPAPETKAQTLESPQKPAAPVRKPKPKRPQPDSSATAPGGGTDSISFRQPVDGAAIRKVSDKLAESISVRDFGAVGDGEADDAAAIQAAIDYAATRADGGSLTRVTLAGGRYRITRGVNIKNRVILADGYLLHTGSEPDEAVVQMGVPSGETLVRYSGAENVYVKTTSTAAGITGFRIDTRVRSSFFKSCFAEMNEGDAVSGRHQVGFEIISSTATHTGGRPGAYQNYLDGNTAYNAHIGFRLRTRGSDAEAKADAEANANYLTNCFAYSCYRSALQIGLGAQENHVSVRADTFVAQHGQGTAIYVVEILGSVNEVDLNEEIGGRADTQYSIRFGPDAINNVVRYHTEQVVTDVVLDEAPGVSKNLAIQKNRLGAPQGQTVNVHHYTRVPVEPLTSDEVRDEWVAPHRAIVTKVAAALDGNTTAPFRCYVAKNGDLGSATPIVFPKGHGADAKFLVTDPHFGQPINPIWQLEAGDRLTFAFSNGKGEPHRASVSVDLIYVGR